MHEEMNAVDPLYDPKNPEGTPTDPLEGLSEGTKARIKAIIDANPGCKLVLVFVDDEDVAVGVIKPMTQTHIRAYSNTLQKKSFFDANEALLNLLLIPEQSDQRIKTDIDVWSAAVLQMGNLLKMKRAAFVSSSNFTK